MWAMAASAEAAERRVPALLAWHLVLGLCCLLRGTSGTQDAWASSRDTWAVIVSSSRYWLNYRHSANALGVYQAVRRSAEH